MDSTRSFYGHVVRVFVPLVLVLAGVMWFFYRSEVSALKALTVTEDNSTVRLARNVVNAELDQLNADLQFLAQQFNLQHWLADPSQVNKAAVTADLRDFVARYPHYDQVRYLDASGKEVIRIDNLAGHPVVVPEQDLQDKSARYYVKAVQALAPGSIYHSPLDLNVEHGRIETPFKPVLRIGTPVVDSKGVRHGMIIMNYLGARLLDNLRDLAGSGGRAVWLVNGDGYWLLGPTYQQEWGFMLPQRSEFRFQRFAPALWKQMQTGPAQQQVWDSHGLMTYLRLAPLSARVNSNVWFLVAYTPESYLNGEKFQRARNLGLVFVLVAALLLFVSWLLAKKEGVREQVEARVRDSEQRYRSLINGAPDAIVIVDQKGRIQMINAEAERSFGYTRAELVGLPLETLLPERYRHQHVENCRQYAANPILRPMGTDMELFALRKDGSEYPVEISLSPLQQDNELLVTAIVRDVSLRQDRDAHIRELNQHLEQRSRELETINGELESFSYSVSHDLRTPLRAMDGFSRTILEDYGDKLDDRGRDRLERIRAATQRMAHLIDDLLTLSRISRAEVRHEKVSITNMANQVLAELHEAEPTREVDVRVQPDLEANGDARLLSVVISNLLSNAWKFTSRTEHARIEVSGKEENGEFVYSVRDNGAGFDMNYANKLFGAFQRLHDATEFPGTGIGLATVQRVIHKHGGRTWAESAVNAGATFNFTLAREQAHA